MSSRINGDDLFWNEEVEVDETSSISAGDRAGTFWLIFSDIKLSPMSSVEIPTVGENIFWAYIKPSAATTQPSLLNSNYRNKNDFIEKS